MTIIHKVYNLKMHLCICKDPSGSHSFLAFYVNCKKNVYAYVTQIIQYLLCPYSSTSGTGTKTDETLFSSSLWFPVVLQCCFDVMVILYMFTFLCRKWKKWKDCLLVKFKIMSRVFAKMILRISPTQMSSIFFSVIAIIIFSDASTDSRALSQWVPGGP